MRVLSGIAKRFHCAGAAALFAFALGCGAAHAQSLVIGDAPSVTPADAWDEYFDSRVSVSPARASDPLIERTASALGDDPTRIYTFVRNEIEVVPLFGVQKGARGCLIDKACTPFDQAHLLAELLRAADTHNASISLGTAYEFREVTLSLTQMTDWLGVANQSALNDVLADGGFPFSVSGSNYTLLHLVVRITLNATTYRLDPSFKSHTNESGLSNLDALMGFSAGAFMSTGSGGALYQSSSSAPTGGTTGQAMPQVAALNRTNVRANLQTYSANLLSGVSADAELDEIIGGRDIVPLGAALPAAPGYTLGTVRATFNNDVPLSLRTQVTVTLGGATPWYWTLDEFYGEELALIPMEIFPNANQPNPDPVQFRFYRNGQAITGWRNGVEASVAFAFDHPYAANNGAYLDRTLTGGGFFHAGAVQFLVGGGRMTPDFGAYLESRSSGEEGYVSVQPPPVGGEYPERIVIGGQRATKRRYAASFATQFGSALGMAGELGDATIALHDFLATAHTIPVIGGAGATPQATIATLSVEGAVAVNSNTASASGTQAARRAAGALLAVLEGSAIEQNMDTVNTASTATRFDWFSSSNENASTDRRFYWVTLANDDDVLPLIEDDAYYGGADSRGLAQAFVNQGYTVIVPRSSYLGPGEDEIITCVSIGPIECAFPGPERGTAIVAISPAGIAHVVVAQNRLLKGAAGTDDAETNPSRIFSIPEDFLEQQFTSRAEAYNVDLGTGAVTYTPPPDLVVGEGAYPYSLSFQRTYRSGAPYQRNHPDPPPPLLPEFFQDSGWTSNWTAEARMENDGQRAFGDQSPREATDTIVAIRVLLALSPDQGSDLATLQYQLGAVHTMAWLSEQLSYNAVQIVEGADNRSFFRLADGTFLGQPGDPTQIELLGERYVPVDTGAYTPPRWYYNRMCVRATNPDGSTSYYGRWISNFTACDFTNTVGQHRATDWMRFRRQSFREGVVVSFDGATLSNNLGRSITLSGAAVRDDAAPSTRRVTFNLDLPPTGPGTLSVTGTDGETWVYNGSDAANWRVFAPSAPSDPIVTFDFAWDPCPTPPTPCPFSTEQVRGQVVNLTDAVGNEARYYISTGRIGAMDDPLGNPTRTYFDEHNQPVRVTNRLGHDTLTTYDNFRRVASVTYPEGNREEYEYNEWHAQTLVRRVPKPGSPLTPIETETDYADTEATFFSTCGMPQSQTDANDNVTSYALVTNRCLISTMTQPEVDDGTTVSTAEVNPVTTYTWNSLGQLLTRVDPTGREVRNTYNGTTNYLETVTVENGSNDIITTFGRNAVGDITSVTDPRSNVHAGTYDTSRRLTRYDGPSGTNAATEWRYDEDGLVDRVRQATGLSSPNDWSTTTYEYLETGRVERMIDPDGGITQYSYDALNRPDCVAVRMNAAVYGSLPASACALSTQGPNGADRITRTEYDAEGQVLRERRGYATPQAQIYATRTWTDNGQLETVDDANNNRSTFEYDRFDRLYRLYFPNGTLGSETSSTTDFEQYGYDPNGNRTSVRLRSTDVIAYEYDALNREIFKNIPGGTPADVTSRYDLAGRRTFARFSTSLTPSSTCTGITSGIDYCYDPVGRLSAETSFGWRIRSEYDAASNRTRITYVDGNHVQYTYDALNRVDQVQLNSVSTGLNLIADYAYDPMSRRSSLTRGNGGVTTYAYTQASRLSSLAHNLEGATTTNDVNWAYAYNAAGQVSSRNLQQVYERTIPALDQSYNSNGLNQYTSVGGAAFGYSGGDGARGNLVSDGSRTFDYDLENRLLSVSAGGSTIGSLTYDPLGRIRSYAAGGNTTLFLYDGDRLVEEYTGAGVRLRRYAHGPGVDEPLIWYEGSGVASGQNWLIADRQGSIVATTNSAGVATTYAYDAYGIPREWSGPRFRYTGQAMLPELQLYHYKARVYDPVLGRFLQTDPVGYEDDLNLYAYVRNDPLNQADSTGQCPGCRADESNAHTSAFVPTPVPVKDVGTGAAPGTHPTPEVAAATVIQDINPTSIAQNTEYGGRIRETPSGDFYATKPTTSGSGTSVSLPSLTAVDRGDYHTHGNYSTTDAAGNLVPTTAANDSFNSDAFSVTDRTGIANDAAAAAAPGYEGYLGTPSGNMLQYDPVTGQVAPLPPPPRR